MIDDRRRFLAYLLASPFYPLLGCRGRDREAAAEAVTDAILQSPQDALDVFDLAAVAETKIPPAHWGFLMAGSDDGRTMLLNSEAFSKLQIRARRFVDTSKADTTVSFLGRTLKSPIVLSPLSGQEAYHPEGEVGTAGAAGKRGHVFTMSSIASKPIAAIAKALGGGAELWFQCYPTDHDALAFELVKRAEDAGAQLLVFTADTPVRGNRPSIIRAARKDTRACLSCHTEHPTQTPTGSRNPQAFLRQFPHYEGFDLAPVKSFFRPITFDFIAQIRAATKLKIAVKGIVTGEDARSCVDHGVDVVWISNHGGRQENSNVATIEALQEVADAVAGKVPIVFDGGVRRGTDVFKALALGASVVGIGRPQCWGLGAFGRAGVERALELVQMELTKTMQISGCASIGAITREHVRWRT